MADGWNGLLVIDISDPSSPEQIGHYDTDGYACGVTVKGNYAYVADHWDGLVVIDVSDPVNPVKIGNCRAADAMEVAIAENYEYIVDGSNGLVIIDVSAPTNPRLVSDMLWVTLYGICGQ